jgi:hypothetical protein
LFVYVHVRARDSLSRRACPWSAKQALCVVVGSPEVLLQDPCWRRVLERCVASKGWFGCGCSELGVGLNGTDPTDGTDASALLDHIARCVCAQYLCLCLFSPARCKSVYNVATGGFWALPSLHTRCRVSAVFFPPFFLGGGGVCPSCRLTYNLSPCSHLLQSRRRGAARQRAQRGGVPGVRKRARVQRRRRVARHALIDRACLA